MTTDEIPMYRSGGSPGGDPPATLLVLWDIDHTLLDAGGVGQQIYAAAVRQATGRSLAEPWRFDGRTELAAAADALVAVGLDPDETRIGVFLEALVTETRSRARDMVTHGRALPGAAEALSALSTLPGVRQSVLTGNIYPIAALKLSSFGLDGHLDLRIGAYGTDAELRTDLPLHAFDRAERHFGVRYGGENTVVVGDTLRDVATAQAVGARAVAVATGETPAAALAAAGADVVLPDLADTGAVLKAITGRTG
ncbi:HAD hydrolase-like protein [Sphaerisporangium rufum]|uniref:HAD hydrolase-like protein n=1 Tax=Sphaerisporangium rufum TaxID=1381558 RepID=UPI00194E63F7|nr:HAD hydrolase-like protein [Sphaerisporangium rufum]